MHFSDRYGCGNTLIFFLSSLLPVHLSHPHHHPMANQCLLESPPFPCPLHLLSCLSSPSFSSLPPSSVLTLSAHSVLMLIVTIPLLLFFHLLFSLLLPSLSSLPHPHLIISPLFLFFPLSIFPLFSSLSSASLSPFLLSSPLLSHPCSSSLLLCSPPST